MNKILPILLATKDTPLATELTLRTLIKFNNDIDIKLFIGDSGIHEDIYARSVSHFYMRFPQDTQHGEILSELHKKINANNFVTLDSDVEFVDHGLLENMICLLADNFAVCVEYENSETAEHKPQSVPQHNVFPITTVTKSSKKWKFQELNYCQARICPYLALWNNDLMKHIISEVSFGPAIQSGLAKGRFWDTASLLTTVMTLTRNSFVHLRSDKYKHFGSLTWKSESYKNMVKYLTNKINDLKCN